MPIEAKDFERDLEFEAQASVLANVDDDGTALAEYSKQVGVSASKSLGLASTLFRYLIENPEYRERFDKRVAEISAERGIKVEEESITPGCKCDYCEYARIVGRVPDPEVTQKVFSENLELDSTITAVAVDGDNEELEAVIAQLGLTIDEGIIRGKRLAVYLLDNPEYQEALDKRSDEIIAERRAKASKSPTKTETENLIKLGLEPSKELALFLDQLADDAVKGGPLSKPYVDSGAIVIRSQDVIPGVVALNAVCFHKTKFAEVFNNKSESSQMNN